VAATWSPLTFGNVHGVYKPGNVKLRPEHPQGDPGRGRRQVRRLDKPFDLVFHGGSGSLLEEIS
jgi:fructose-bisphosphate aldolase class II